MDHSTSRSDRTPRLGVLGELATRHSTVAFFALAFAASWALWVPAATGLVADSPALVNGLFLLGAFGPPVAALAVTWLAGRRVRTFLVEALAPRVSPRWYLLAIALPVAYFAVPNATVYAALGRSFDPSMLPGRIVRFSSASRSSRWSAAGRRNSAGAGSPSRGCKPTTGRSQRPSPLGSRGRAGICRCS